MACQSSGVDASFVPRRAPLPPRLAEVSDNPVDAASMSLSSSSSSLLVSVYNSYSVSPSVRPSTVNLSRNTRSATESVVV